MKRKIDYTLYLVTDRELMSTQHLEAAVEEAIIGGCTVVQLREKSVSSRELYQTALSIKTVTDYYNIPLIINDRLDIALAVQSDGIHLGQEDLPAAVVRQIAGHDIIIGVSVTNVEQAVKAVANGADYLGVGAMFSTQTKTDAAVVTFDDLKAIRNQVDIPIVVIGGINKYNLPCFASYGINGIAVVSAVISQKDITGAARELNTLFRNNTQART